LSIYSFLESENLVKVDWNKMSARIGGEGANGSTSRDRTNYFQTVPKDALEKNDLGKQTN
jgi:zinc protease